MYMGSTRTMASPQPTGSLTSMSPDQEQKLVPSFSALQGMLQAKANTATFYTRLEVWWLEFL